tara:strand:+ start:30 stop:755 length:726 start_codon:yes stop_codon:yes gene_type:complete
MKNPTHNLIIDTSTAETLLAISNEDKIIDDHSWVSNKNESKTLLLNLDKLLIKNNLNLDSINSILTTIGPGGFSSLRIGLSTAKSIAITKSIKLIPIPSLLVAAYELIKSSKKYVSIIKCSKSTYYLKDYSNLTINEIISEKEYSSFEVVEINKIHSYIQKNYMIISYDYDLIYNNNDIKLEKNIIKTKNKIESIMHIGKIFDEKYNFNKPTNINPIYANSGQISSAIKLKNKGVKNWKKH